MSGVKRPMRLRDAWSVSRNLHYLFHPAPGSFRSIDGLRGSGSLWIISAHTVFYAGFLMPERFLPQYGHLVKRPILRFVEQGQLGLDMFFAISGFLIAHLLLVEHRKTGTILIRRFYVRRALRLLPAYSVGLLIYCLTIRINCDTAWANIFYVNNFIPVVRQCMTWTWSLAIEEQFYIVFPGFLLLFLRLRRFQVSIMVGLLVLSVAVRWLVVHQGGFSLPVGYNPRMGDPTEFARYFDALYCKPYTRFGPFVVGLLMAHLHNNTDLIARFSRMRFASLIGGVGLIVPFVLLVAPDVYFSEWDPVLSTVYMTTGRLLFAIVSCGVVAACLSTTMLGKAVGFVFESRVWYPLSQLSYSVYLLHPTVIIISYAVWLRPRVVQLSDLLVYFIIFVVISHALALLLYLGVERPIMNLRRHPRVLRWEGAPSAVAISREDRTDHMSRTKEKTKP